MKKASTEIREMKRELHYHQMMVRMDLRAAKAGMAKCKEIAARMRKIQKGDGRGEDR